MQPQGLPNGNRTRVLNEDAGSIPNQGLGVAFSATGPGLVLIMYILTTLEFPTHNFNFHLLTTSVNAKYYYRIPVRSLLRVKSLGTRLGFTQIFSNFKYANS